MNPDSATLPSPRRYSRRQFGQTAAGILLFFSMNPGAVFGQMPWFGSTKTLRFYERRFAPSVTFPVANQPGYQ